MQLEWILHKPSHKSCYADAGSDDDDLTIKTVNTVNLRNRKSKELRGIENLRHRKTKELHD